MNFKRPNKETVLLYSSEGRCALWRSTNEYVIILSLLLEDSAFILLYQLHAHCQFEV